MFGPPGVFGQGIFPKDRPQPKPPRDTGELSAKLLTGLACVLVVGTIGALVIGALSAAGHLNPSVVSGYAIGLGALGVSVSLWRLKEMECNPCDKQELAIRIAIGIVFAACVTIGGLNLGGVLPSIAPAATLITYSSIAILGLSTMIWRQNKHHQTLQRIL